MEQPSALAIPAAPLKPARVPVSVVIPCKDEAGSLRALLPRIRHVLPGAEVLVVDDGSTDDTVQVCQEQGVCCISHPYGMGNGAAVKTGARRASGELIVFMDGDGQHDSADIPRLLDKLAQGYDMAVGARHRNTQASWARRWANAVFINPAFKYPELHRWLQDV